MSNSRIRRSVAPPSRSGIIRTKSMPPLTTHNSCSRLLYIYAERPALPPPTPLQPAAEKRLRREIGCSSSIHGTLLAARVVFCTKNFI
uniref:Uncharacterized protein n=1 Tax=Trichogramma kaykai TaxID=54128 RepID=A0ABD2VUB6_9HYME